MRYANEGYLKWATNNGAKIGAFEAGANFSQKFRRFQMRSGSSSSKKVTLTLDSLLTESGLSNTQKNYILELPEIVAESKNIAHLERELNAFDKKVYKELGEEDSKPVLRMSAIMHASMDFITTNAKLLGTLAELVEENNRKQSYFYRPSLRNDKKNLFQFAQSQDGPTDPPDWGDFYNGYDMASATLGGAFTGAGSVGPAGAGVGSYFGPWGTAIGGVIGGFVGGIGGGGINGTLEYQSQLKEYGDE